MEQQFPEIKTKSLPAVKNAVREIYARLFPSGRLQFIDEAFRWIEDAFAGRYADYQRIDAKYHDLEHTLQVTLCFVRLLEGYQSAGSQPQLTQRAFELGLLAILLHDTGYLKKLSDTEGTGAKYTLVHVSRSADFAAALLKEKGFPLPDVRAVQNMIRCTGVNADLRSIPFQGELEKKVGFALGTADLLGQMAADDYVEKLSILYQEFEESNRYHPNPNTEGFNNATELKRKTPVFWESYVIPKISDDFLGLYHFLNRPYPNGANYYLQCIKANIERLHNELGLPGEVAAVP